MVGRSCEAAAAAEEVVEAAAEATGAEAQQDEDLTGDAEETIEIADSEDEAAVPSDAVELGGSGSDDDDADPPAPPAVRVKTEQ